MLFPFTLHKLLFRQLWRNISHFHTSTTTSGVDPTVLAPFFLIEVRLFSLRRFYCLLVVCIFICFGVGREKSFSSKTYVWFTASSFPLSLSRRLHQQTTTAIRLLKFRKYTCCCFTLALCRVRGLLYFARRLRLGLRMLSLMFLPSPSKFQSSLLPLYLLLFKSHTDKIPKSTAHTKDNTCTYRPVQQAQIHETDQGWDFSQPWKVTQDAKEKERERMYFRTHLNPHWFIRDTFLAI